MRSTHIEPGSAERAARITAAAEALDWGKTSLRLERYAFRCMRRGSKEQAMEVAQTAITKLLDPRYLEWDPVKDPDLFEHLKHLVRGELSNTRRLRRTAGEVSTSRDDIETLFDGGENDPEAALANRQIAGEVLRRMSETFAADALATSLLGLMVEGVTTPREQAAASGAPYDDVRNARRRLFHRAGEVARELGWPEGDFDAS